MTIQTLIDCWVTSYPSETFSPPATEQEIQDAEEKIGATFPPPLRELYRFTNGNWIFDLDFYQLDLNEHGFGLVNANEKYIEWKWHIPQEIRLFAAMGGSEVFGIWLPRCGNSIYNHPIIEVGTIFEEGCMGVAGTNLISFLRGWSAYHLMEQEIDARGAFEDGESTDAAMKQIHTALNMLKVPQSLRGEHYNHEIEPFRKWADPQLPDPDGDSYSQRYTITDLKRLFGATQL